jgi:hypothetical protein
MARNEKRAGEGVNLKMNRTIAEGMKSFAENISFQLY